MNVTTARLHIRDLEETDLYAMHEFRGDPVAVQYTDFGSDSLAETQTWLTATIPHNQMQPRLSHNCAIVLRETGAVIGWIGCGTASSPEYGDWAFGYGLIRRYWNQGYMTEALKALLDFSFDELGVGSVYATCEVANPASARVMEKVGMARVARYQDDDGTESYRYRIERKAWRRPEPV